MNEFDRLRQDLKEMLNFDGHMLENAAAMVAATAVAGTQEFTDPLEAMLELTDALAGMNNRVSTSVVNRLTELTLVFEPQQRDIASAAMGAPFLSTDEDRAKLFRALQTKDLAILRAAALDLKVPGQSVTLREKIRGLSQ